MPELPDVSLRPFFPGASKRQYEGSLADRDSKVMITRSYSSTKMEADAVNSVIESGLTSFRSPSDFIRWAVFEGLCAFERDGFPDAYIPDILSHIGRMRKEAEQLRLRQDFAEILLTYETSLNRGLDVGDYDLVHDTLEELEGYIARTPDNFWKNHLKRTILKSVIVKGAIDAFYEAARGEPEMAERAVRWQLWLEGLVE